jgi:hypothetical protein
MINEILNNNITNNSSIVTLSISVSVLRTDGGPLVDYTRSACMYGSYGILHDVAVNGTEELLHI